MSIVFILLNCVVAVTASTNAIDVWSSCETIPSHARVSCSSNMAARWKETTNNSTNAPLQKVFEVEKCNKLCSEENCTWTGTPWASWEDCNMTEGNCGNGFRFRKREYCICGGHDVQTDETICGIAPTQIQSCYILCNDTCNRTNFTIISEGVAGTLNYVNISDTRPVFVDSIAIMPKPGAIPMDCSKNEIAFSKFVNPGVYIDNKFPQNVVKLNRSTSSVPRVGCLYKYHRSSVYAQGLRYKREDTTDSVNISYCDLKRKYKTWNEWGLCEGEDKTCYSIGTKTRKRVCISESVYQSNVDHCVGPATQKDWCEMPCKENCTWNGTQWGDWGKCINFDGCGSGYSLRKREHCMCGKYNETQKNTTVCGIPPTHIKSCYEPCKDKCNHKDVSYNARDMKSMCDGSDCNIDLFKLVYVISITIKPADQVSTPIKVEFYRINPDSSEMKEVHNNATVSPGAKVFPFEPPVYSAKLRFKQIQLNDPDIVIINMCDMQANYSQWSNWSICISSNKTCNTLGSRHRTRDCQNSSTGASIDSKYCRGTNLSMDSCLMPCLHYNWSGWENKTQCVTNQQPCGKGTIYRTRNCTANDTKYPNDEDECRKRYPGETANETIDCFLPCYEFTNWTNWRNRSGGGYIRNRTCERHDEDFANVTVNKIKCNGSDVEEIVMTKWSEWSNCTCEEQSRTRKCNSTNCLHFNTTETQKCNSSCSEWLRWSDWGSCNCTVNRHIRTRVCKFDECDKEEQSEVCPDNECSEGTWSTWENLTQCSETCGGGKKTLRRTCVGGKCVGSAKKTEDCNTKPCSINGNFSDWSTWTSCSVSCSKGIKTRERTCTNPSPFRGENCTGSYTDQKQCNMGSCPGPSISKDNNCTSYCVKKNLICSSEFTEVSIESLNCTKPSNTALHKWYEEYHPSYNQDSQLCEGFKQTNTQKACDKVNTSSSNILRICVCVRLDDIGYGSWSLWGECDVACGLGKRVRQRVCLNESNCAKEGQQQTRTCAANLCPIDGGWGAWEPWRECNATCGMYGTRERVRYCINPAPTKNGRECGGDKSQEEPCNRKICPIHGNWSDWSEWSMCDKPCNNGSTTKTRMCNNPNPQYGGKKCQGKSLETKRCNFHKCKDIEVDISVYFTEETYFESYEDKHGYMRDRLQMKVKENITSLYGSKTAVVKDVIIHSIKEANYDEVPKKRKSN